MKSEQVFLLYIWLYINILNTKKKKTHTPLSFSIENKTFTHYNKTIFMQIKIV